MVEGSQIDWAAHDNDTYAAVTDFLEFNKAVAIALEFAKKDKNTVVIICPDHGTGGITIGNEYSGKGYQEMSIGDTIIKPLMKVDKSRKRLAELMLENKENVSEELLVNYLKEYHIEDTSKELLESFRFAITGGDADDFIDDEDEYETRKGIIQSKIGKLFNKQNFVGWTTGGHTAEDVFLAIYAPKKVKRLTGIVDNYEIGKYIAAVLNLEDFDAVTNKIYKKHSEYFSEDEVASLNYHTLVVNKNGKELTFEANSNVLKIKGEKDPVRLSSIVIRRDGIYFLPESIEKHFR